MLFRSKDLYECPFIVSDESKDPEKRAHLTQRFTKCIKDVIEDFIPVQQILETYIPSFTGGELDVDQGVGPDPADCDEGADPTPLESAEALPDVPAPTTPEAPEGTAPDQGGEEGKGEEAPKTPVPEVADPTAETKKIPVHHETLFDDAPDKK